MRTKASPRSQRRGTRSSRVSLRLLTKGAFVLRQAQDERLASEQFVRERLGSDRSVRERLASERFVRERSGSDESVREPLASQRFVREWLGSEGSVRGELVEP